MTEAHIGRRIASNTVVQLIGKAITVATSLVMLSMILKYLGVADYGDYGTSLAYTGIFLAIVDLGFFLIIVREITKTPQRRGELVSNAFTIKLVAGLLVFGTAYLISYLLPYSPQLRWAILITAASYLCMSLSQITISVLQADLEMQKSAISDVIGRIVTLLALWVVIRLNGGFIWVVVTTLIGNLALLLTNIVWVSRKTKFHLAFDFTVWKDLFIEALPMGIALILSTIYFRIDTVMLSLLQSSAAVGIYAAPYKILEVILTFPGIFLSSVFPALVDRLKRPDDSARQMFQTSFNVLIIVALPVIAGLSIFAQPIIQLIGGADFSASAHVLQILVWAAGISYVNSLMIYTLIASNRQKQLILPYAIAALLNIVANLILIPMYSYIGAAYTTIATEGVVLLATTVMVTRLRLLPQLTLAFKTLLATVVMAAVILLLHLGLWVGIIIGGLVYLVCLMIFGVLDKQLITHLWPRK